MQIDYASLAGVAAWSKHLQHLEATLKLLEEAEDHAKELRAAAKAFATRPRTDG